MSEKPANLRLQPTAAVILWAPAGERNR